MKKVSFLLFFLCAYLSQAQIVQKTVNSGLLQQKRDVRIYVPEGYDENPEKTYPLILVLDADYLFHQVVGNVQYYTYQDKMPASIVVGINQAKFREADTKYGLDTSFPTGKSAAFYAFIQQEVLPHINSFYRTADFSVIVGDGLTANFINYFLLKDPALFDAYISLSPDFAPMMEDMIMRGLSNVKKQLWYFVSSGKNDIPKITKAVNYLESQFPTLENENLHLDVAYFDGYDHYSTIAYALPYAFEKLFLTYGPILPIEYENKVLKAVSYADYLIQKYADIKDFYNINLKYRHIDIMAVTTAIEKNENWVDYKILAELTAKEFPETAYSEYFMGRLYEEMGEPEKAFKSYQNAYLKEGVSFVTKDLIWKKINQLKADFGYN